MINILDKTLETFAKLYGKFWDTLVKIIFSH